MSIYILISVTILIKIHVVNADSVDPDQTLHFWVYTVFQCYFSKVTLANCRTVWDING